MMFNSLPGLVQWSLSVLVPQVGIGPVTEKNSRDLRPPKASGIMQRRRPTQLTEQSIIGHTKTREYHLPLPLVDVCALLAEELDHLAGSEGGGPVEERLADVVHEVDLDCAAIDGLDERVGVL